MGDEQKLILVNPETISITVGEDGAELVLRPPTDKELNKFLDDRFRITSRRGSKDMNFASRSAVVAKFVRGLLIDAKGFGYESVSGSNVVLDKGVIISDDDKEVLSKATGRTINKWQDAMRDKYLIKAGLYFEDIDSEDAEFTDSEDEGEPLKNS